MRKNDNKARLAVLLTSLDLCAEHRRFMNGSGPVLVPEHVWSELMSFLLGLAREKREEAAAQKEEPGKLLFFNRFKRAQDRY